MNRWNRTYLHLVGLLLIGGSAIAEDARARRAREEVERELQALVRTPAPRISVELVPLDEPNLKCQSIELLLNGRVLPISAGANLNAEQPIQLYSGEVRGGRHELISRVDYEDTSSVMFSENAGVKWKVSSSARFDIQDGLEIVVKIVPERVPGEKDLKRAIRVKLQHSVNMVATVDTSMPPPLQKKVEVQVAEAHVPHAPNAATPERPTQQPKNRGSAGQRAKKKAVAQEPVKRDEVADPAKPGEEARRAGTDVAAREPMKPSEEGGRSGTSLAVVQPERPGEGSGRVEARLVAQRPEPLPIVPLVVDEKANRAQAEKPEAPVGLETGWSALVAGLFVVLVAGAVMVLRRRR